MLLPCRLQPLPSNRSWPIAPDERQRNTKECHAPARYNAYTFGPCSRRGSGKICLCLALSPQMPAPRQRAETQDPAHHYRQVIQRALAALSHPRRPARQPPPSCPAHQGTQSARGGLGAQSGPVAPPQVPVDRGTHQGQGAHACPAFQVILAIRRVRLLLESHHAPSTPQGP